MLLRLLHPEVAFRDCGHCQKFEYEPDGAVRVDAHDRPMRRDPRCTLPCRFSKSRCPKGTPEKSLELSYANWLCYKHYQRCAAVGRFPDDPLVAEHAAIIHEAEREAWETKQLAAMRAGIPWSGAEPPTNLPCGTWQKF